MNISVVIPLYNKRGYVEEAIASILAQTVPPFEIIVVDDGSTDGGADLVASMNVPNLRLIQQQNGGVSVARNRGVVEAKGDYVAFLDADDRYLPVFLESITNLGRRFPGAGMLCSSYIRIYPDGKSHVSGLCSQPAGASLLVDNFHQAWSAGSFAHTDSIVIRRNALLALGTIFPPGERLGEDQDVWFRVAETQQVAYLNQPLVEYRIDVPGAATQGSQVLDPLPCFVRLSARLDSPTFPPRLRRGAQRLVASHWINVARARAQVGQVAGAMTLLRDRRSRANFRYWAKVYIQFHWRFGFKVGV